MGPQTHLLVGVVAPKGLKASALENHGRITELNRLSALRCSSAAAIVQWGSRRSMSASGICSNQIPASRTQGGLGEPLQTNCCSPP